MNLYPCAYSMTFNVTKELGKDKLTLNAILNQRSQDILAANNWNVCQYSLLLMMIAQCCDMEAGELVHVIADCHIYDRHVPVIKELISRTPYPAPTVKLNPNVKNFYDFTTDDLIVENYQTWPQIKNIPIAFKHGVNEKGFQCRMRFRYGEAAVAGYGNRIWAKISRKVGRADCGNDF